MKISVTDCGVYGWALLGQPSMLRQGSYFACFIIQCSCVKTRVSSVPCLLDFVSVLSRCSVEAGSTLSARSGSLCKFDLLCVSLVS